MESRAPHSAMPHGRGTVCPLGMGLAYTVLGFLYFIFAIGIAFFLAAVEPATRSKRGQKGDWNKDGCQSSVVRLSGERSIARKKEKKRDDVTSQGAVL